MKRPPDISISRLAVYLRFLKDYARDKDSKSTINSTELARFLEMHPHQIRKDFSYFGKFGERGVGYRIQDLREHINKILGLGRDYRLCLLGMGNLGTALFAYAGFKEMRLDIVAIFDDDPKKIGKRFRGTRVYHPQSIPGLVKKLKIDIAILTLPSGKAQEAVDKLTRAGVTAILNFAPLKLNAPKNVKLRNVDLSTELINLTHFLSGIK
ncbi:redox-sensing transcriptional repressor Rex [Candidatus Omnitrophota bacterium]